MSDQWIEVDRDGMRKVLARRTKWFILTEPIQNAVDENITQLDVEFRVTGRNRCELVVTDDSPKGFEDLADAYTLYKPSKKINDATLRGCFNKGCKDVMAFAVSGNIETTTGSVRFLDSGERVRGRKSRKTGTQVAFVLRLSQEEYNEACSVIPMLHLPPDIKFTFNGQLVRPVEPIHTFEATLPTTIADLEGILRSTARKTEVRIYDHPSGQKFMYEMGIPVCELGDDKYSYDVQQRVPLNVERDNVTPAYLRKLRVLAFNEVASHIETSDEANANWAREAAADPAVEEAAFNRSLNLRWGEKRVSYDPSDPDAAGAAIGDGAAVIHGRNMAAGEWANARRFGAVLPAGQVYPTHSGTVPVRQILKDSWTKWQRVTARYWREMAKHLLGKSLTVEIVEAPPTVGTVAKYEKTEAGAVVQWNVAHPDFPDLTGVCQKGISEAIDDLMIHEFTHEYADSHYGPEILDAATRLAAKFKALALSQPEVFAFDHLNRPFGKND